MDKRPDFPNYTDVLTKCGEPFFCCGKRTLRVNASFFAELYCKRKPLKNLPGLGFIVYTGTGWSEFDDMALRNDLEMLVDDIALDCDVHGKVRATEADLVEIVKILKRRTMDRGLAKPDPNAIPAANVLLYWGEMARDFEERQYTPDVFVMNHLAIRYDSSARAPQFESVIEEIMPDPDDRRVVQEYLGAALFPANRTRKFLLCYGEGGCGKSVLILFLTKILGAARVFDLNIESVKHDYALAGLKTQTLLTASEAASRALCTDGAEWVKKAVGGDFFQTQMKFRNEKSDHHGTFSLVIVSNNRLQFQYEGRGDEWRDRLIPIFFGHHIPEGRRELGLVDRLLQEEGPGIFNWFLEGARRVRRNNWKIELSPVQRDRIERLLALSDPMAVFVRDHIVRSAGEYFTSADAWKRYVRVHENAGLPMLEEKTFYKKLAKAMGEIHRTTGMNSLPGRQRGYRGFVLIKENLAEPRVYA